MTDHWRHVSSRSVRAVGNSSTAGVAELRVQLRRRFTELDGIMVRHGMDHLCESTLDVARFERHCNSLRHRNDALSAALTERQRTLECAAERLARLQWVNGALLHFDGDASTTLPSALSDIVHSAPNRARVVERLHQALQSTETAINAWK